MGRWPLVIAIAAPLMIATAAACGGISTSPPSGQPLAGAEQTPSALPTPPDPAAVPPLDTSQHTVPLEDVVFDTFDGRFVRLPDASDDLVLRLRDAIRPVYVPLYDTVEDATLWLRDDDNVMGIELDGRALAYPVKTLASREIVNEVIGGRPIAITYCPLCASGVVYDRRLDGRTLLFGNTSALFEFDLVMYDHQTGSYWHQLGGEAIVGPLAGARLEHLASLMATFGEWRALHPDTLVLANGKVQAPLASDPTKRIQSSVNRGDFFFPVSRGLDDDRLELGAIVLMIRLSGQWKAYPLSESEAPIAHNDAVAGVPLVVYTRGLSAGAYLSTVDGQPLTFTPQDSSEDLYRDQQTGSTWDLAGRAVSGPLRGARLDPVPSKRGFWFAVAGSNPGIDLYQPPEP